jgi:hypothetical protein
MTYDPTKPKTLLDRVKALAYRPYARYRQLRQEARWSANYVRLREPKTMGPPSWSEPGIMDKVVTDLIRNGFDVHDLYVDIADYEGWLDKVDYRQYVRYSSASTVRNEKTFEHYLSDRLLQLNSDDIYIDIANCYSPVPEIFKQLYGCNVYRQDLVYPNGIRGNVIGGRAENLPLPDSSVSKMALHCSFEHFEGQSDILFIKEADRVLRSGGRLCILPLYLYKNYIISTDPGTIPRGGLPFDDGALVHAIKSGLRHSRWYDVAHLSNRIRDNLGDLRLTLYVIRNLKDIDKVFYCNIAAVFWKP